MDKDKYYTPEIEEFHIGFEFEFETGTEGWKKFTFDKDRPENVLSNAKDFPTQFRVKHLDKEDIEEVLNELEIWWKYDRKDDYYTGYELSEWTYIWFSNGDMTNIWIKHINANNGDRNDVPLIIRNKSEFRKLVKQLDVL